jgi:hypothetical protein
MRFVEFKLIRNTVRSKMLTKKNCAPASMAQNLQNGLNNSGKVAAKVQQAKLTKTSLGQSISNGIIGSPGSKQNILKKQVRTYPYETFRN